MEAGACSNPKTCSWVDAWHGEISVMNDSGMLTTWWFEHVAEIELQLNMRDEIIAFLEAYWNQLSACGSSRSQLPHLHECGIYSLSVLAYPAGLPVNSM